MSEPSHVATAVRRDPRVLGKSVQLDGHASIIVGVLPPAFQIYLPAYAGMPTNVDAWRVIPIDFATNPRDGGSVGPRQRHPRGSRGAGSRVNHTRRGGGKNAPVARRDSKVTILDVFENAASVKVEGPEWVDYLHLVKWNGEWVIVNVLWEFKGPAKLAPFVPPPRLPHGVARRRGDVFASYRHEATLDQTFHGNLDCPLRESGTVGDGAEARHRGF